MLRALTPARMASVSWTAEPKPVMDRISYRENGAGLLVVAPQVAVGLPDLDLPPDALVVVLENVEKPGNLGAILRTADADAQPAEPAPSEPAARATP